MIELCFLVDKIGRWNLHRLQEGVMKVLQVTQSCSLSSVTPACHDTHKLQDKKSCSRHEGDRPVNPCAQSLRMWQVRQAACMKGQHVTSQVLRVAGQGNLYCIHDTILRAVLSDVRSGKSCLQEIFHCFPSHLPFFFSNSTIQECIGNPMKRFANKHRQRGCIGYNPPRLDRWRKPM
jgi:hypothetical protein